MCLNRKYTDQEKREIDEMTAYARMILQGVNPADIALDEGVSEEYVSAVIEKIKDINPYLYNQVKEKLASK